METLGGWLMHVECIVVSVIAWRPWAGGYVCRLECPHCAVNRVQHTHAEVALGAIVCKSMYVARVYCCECHSMEAPGRVAIYVECIVVSVIAWSPGRVAMYVECIVVSVIAWRPGRVAMYVECIVVSVIAWRPWAGGYVCRVYFCVVTDELCVCFDKKASLKCVYVCRERGREGGGAGSVS